MNDVNLNFQKMMEEVGNEQSNMFNQYDNEILTASRYELVDQDNHQNKY